MGQIYQLMLLSGIIYKEGDSTVYVNQNYDVDLFGFGEKYFSELSLEIRKKWSTKFDNIILFVNQFYNKKFVEETTGEVKSSIVVLENTYKINET